MAFCLFSTVFTILLRYNNNYYSSFFFPSWPYTRALITAATFLSGGGRHSALFALLSAKAIIAWQSQSWTNYWSCAMIEQLTVIPIHLSSDLHKQLQTSNNVWWLGRLIQFLILYRLPLAVLSWIVITLNFRYLHYWDIKIRFQQ